MYDNLITQINDYIRANASNDITGPGLNTILMSMIQVLGAGMTFYGIADLTTVPVSTQGPKFYLAFTPGTYTRFNIENQPHFTSGFAVLYDELGNNTWRMTVKPGSSDTIFLVDADVKNNTFGSDTVFYIKEASRENNNSSFTIYALNKNTSTEQLVATSTFLGSTLYGYKTHEINVGTTKYTVSVNWDDIPLNDRVTFTYEDSKFPSTAYVEKVSDIDYANLLSRVKLVETIAGGYRITDSGAYSRTSLLAADFYAGDIPDFNSPTTYTDAQGMPPWGTNIRCGLLLDSSVAFNLDLKPNNFPAYNVYYIYILNNTQAAGTCNIRKFDTAGSTVLSTTTHNISANAILEVKIIKHGDSRVLHYAVTEML